MSEIVTGKLRRVDPVSKVKHHMLTGQFEIIEEAGSKYLTQTGDLIQIAANLFESDDGRSASIQYVGERGALALFRLTSELK